MDEKMFYVDPSLASRIRAEIHRVCVVPCYSMVAGRVFMWAIKQSDTEWRRSLEVIFRHPQDYFETRAIRVRSDMAAQRYRIFGRPDPRPVVWPTKDTAGLLTEALGPDGIIRNAGHPVYVELTSGEELL